MFKYFRIYPPNTIIIIVTENFEKLLSDYATTEMDYRLAHDFDQDSVISDQYKDISDKNCKFILINHIGNSKGEDIYQRALVSALGSDFAKMRLQNRLNIQEHNEKIRSSDWIRNSCRIED